MNGATEQVSAHAISREPQNRFCIHGKKMRILTVISKEKHGRTLYMKATGIVRRIDD